MLVAQFDSQIGLYGYYWLWSIEKDGKVIGYVVSERNKKANAIREFLENGCIMSKTKFDKN